jgi:hypothetical protein
MNELQTINEHITIRNTIGYDLISKIDVCDVPNVLKFLKIVDNYINMSEIN